jgi:DNA invertase Pin-like site-specific DNA recombinase
MKHEQKTKNAKRKDADIISDFTKMFKKGIYVREIYRKLAYKYYCTEDTIYRTVVASKISDAKKKECKQLP